MQCTKVAFNCHFYAKAAGYRGFRKFGIAYVYYLGTCNTHDKHQTHYIKAVIVHLCYNLNCYIAFRYGFISVHVLNRQK